ncbi:type II toxin-antitoxin system PemK/MazF family toxin [Acrocarpospora sp. B8E8]|uniref:type II toxin-antitoxin system PemK/MazF family toxin n=1 Tax=Acrocarpospora sp. B8E8 TaxID=3153572 RepID=UPI00325EA245
MRVQQGDIWFTDLGVPRGTEQGSARPTLIISNDGFNRISQGLVVVVPLTTRDRGWDTHLPIRVGKTGLRQDSWAMLQQVRSVSVERFKFRIGHVSNKTLDEVVELLSELF